MDKKIHDFKQPLEKTSVALAMSVLDVFKDNFDYFVYEDNELSKEKEQEIIEKTTDLSINIMSIMGSTDIPADYATYCIDKIIAGLNGIKSYIDGTIRQQNDEIISRVLGAKSPVTNTYAKDCATLGDLMLALKKVREDTGGDPYDYFIKDKLSTDVDKV